MVNVRPDKVDRVVLQDADGNVIGYGEGCLFPPLWAERGLVLHSSDLRVPINDRTAKLFTVHRSWQHQRNTRVGIVELVSADWKAVTKKASFPEFSVLGQKVTLGHWLGMDQNSRHFVPELFEVRVGGKLIGSVSAEGDAGTVFSKASRLAKEFLEARTEAQLARPLDEAAAMLSTG